MISRELEISEWQRAAAGDAEYPALAGLFLDEPQLAAALARARLRGRLRLSETRHGLVVEARQHVGVLQLGPLRVRILPKLPLAKLWVAVAYALGLDALCNYGPVDTRITGDFADLLALMLLHESERLWRTGVQRGYHPVSEWRTTPRGRPDLLTLARSGPLTRAALPCRHQDFTADIDDNKVVAAGLELARSMSSKLELRSALARASQQWATICTPSRLDRELLREIDRRRTRLDARYAGAHRLVRLLYERSGLDDPEASGEHSIPGYLWNMATLFERFVARFLTEHLPVHEVVAQHQLGDLYRVVWDRPGRRTPQPQPDLVVRNRATGRTVGVFDTKYKDLWSTKIPREILYQMSVYSLAWSESAGHDVPVIVLYPAAGEHHRDIEYALDVHKGRTRKISLRAVDWGAAIRAVETSDHCAGHRLAGAWVLGPC